MRSKSVPISTNQPQIVLIWLVRLRWLAVAGQLVAVAIARLGLGLELTLWPAATVILLTALTNILAAGKNGVRNRFLLLLDERRLALGLLVLDLCLLTVLLFCTGGGDNPFCTLYLVHVAMAVVMLGPGWTWGIVALAAAFYGALLRWHLPLRPLPSPVVAAGQWMSLALVCSLVAYFLGRVMRELRRHELKLAAVRDLASRNEQLAALTTLAAGAAHELGTPLATIAVVARELELTSRGLSPDEGMAEDARLIRSEVDRCRAILDRMRVDILEDAGQKVTRVRVEELVGRVKESLRPWQRERLEVYVDPRAAEAAVSMRAVQQAVGVLIQNAFDATPDERPVKLAVDRQDGQVVFQVEDHGCGMPEDVLRRAGQPFFTTKPPGQGMGLGLFLVRLVAEKFGGVFKLDSRPGAGTRSMLAIPDSGAGATS